MKRLVLPEDTPEMYLNDDFEVYVCPDQILDPEKAKAEKGGRGGRAKSSQGNIGKKEIRCISYRLFKIRGKALEKKIVELLGGNK